MTKRHRVVDENGEVTQEVCPNCLLTKAEMDRLTRSFQGSLQRQHQEIQALKLELTQLRIQVPEQGEKHDQIMEVLEYWRTRCAPRAIIAIDSPRYRKVKERLEDKLEGRGPWTVEELKMAVDGALLSPYHCGQNETGTKHVKKAETIFREPKTVTNHLERAMEQFEERDAAWWAQHGWSEPEDYRRYLRAELDKLDRTEVYFKPLAERISGPGKGK